MKLPTNMLETLIGQIEIYAKCKLELTQLIILDKVSDLLSSFISSLLILCFALIFLLMFNIALALWLGEYFGKNYYGFLAVSIFYFVVGLLFNLVRKNTKMQIRDSIIKQSLN